MIVKLEFKALTPLRDRSQEGLTVKVLCRVPSVIERDALMVALLEAGVNAMTPERSVMVNLANEPNIALEGASIHFNGYDIRVPEDQFEKARAVLGEFRRRHDVRLAVTEDIEDTGRVDAAGRRFLACTFWAIALPLVMNAAALYWFFRSRDVLKKRTLLTIGALAFNGFIGALAIFLLVRMFKESF